MSEQARGEEAAEGLLLRHDRHDGEEEEEGGELGGFFSEEAHRAPNVEVHDLFGRCGPVVSIAQESRMHLGGRVWGASLHMLRYFSRCCESSSSSSSSSSQSSSTSSSSSLYVVEDDDVENKQQRHRWQRPILLEMGAGTGLLGIGMALAPGVEEVRLTDKADLLPHIAHNIRTNPIISTTTSSSSSGVMTNKMAKAVEMELDWMKWEDEGYWCPGGAGHRAADGVSVVLAADCIYFSVLYRPFLETLKRICRAKRRQPHQVSLGSSQGGRARGGAGEDEPVVCYLCNDDGRTAQNRMVDDEKEEGKRWDDDFFALLAVDFAYELIDTDAVLRPEERDSDMRLYRVWPKSDHALSTAV